MKIRVNETLTRKRLDELYLGFAYFEKGVNEKTPISKWKDKDDFIKEVEKLTNVNLKNAGPKFIKDFEQALEEHVSAEEKVEANKPTNEQLETFEKEATERTSKQKAAVENAKKTVEAAIKKQQELKASLKTNEAPEKVYAKVVQTAQHPTPEEITAQKAIEELKTEWSVSGKSQHQTIEIVSQQLKENLTPALSKEMPPEQVDFLCESAATKFVVAINNPDAQTQYAETAKQNAILSNLTTSNIVPESARVAAGSVFEANAIPTETDRFIINIGYGKGLGYVFGPSPGDFDVSFYNEPATGTFPVDIGKLNDGFGNILKDQAGFINSITGDPKSFLINKASGWLEGYISKLPADSFLGQLDSAAIKNVLSFAGGGGVSIPIESVAWLGEIATKIPGGLSTINAIGGIFGVSFTGGAAATGVAGGTAAAGTAAAVSTVGAEVAATAAGTAIGTTGGTAAGAALGTVIPVPVVGPIIGAIVGFVASQGKKIWNWVKDKIPDIGKYLVVGFGAGAGFLLSGGTFLGALGGGLIGFGGASLVGGGIAGLGASMSGLGTGIIGIFGALGGAFLGAVGTPILVILLVFPVVVALIMFIINSGAYVVPPTSSNIISNLTNPYIGVEKVAVPEGPFQNSQLPLTIKYTVTITAKKGPLESIVFSEDCQAIKKSGSVNCPTINLPNPPDTISPSSPYTFDYSTTYENNTYTDSAIINNVKVTAKTVDAGNQTATGGTSIIIGSPPTECFVLDKTWNAYPKYRVQMMGAIAELSKATTYMSTLCAGHTIPLSYTGQQTGYAGEVRGGTIYFHVFGLSLGAHGTLYTLTHETGHLYASWVQGKFSKFAYDTGVQSEGFVCTYLLNKQVAEDFPESIALFVSHTSNTNNACLTNYKTQYPKHWQFVRDYIFYSNLDW